MVSIKTTQAEYFIPALESADEVKALIEKTTDGFIRVTLPDNNPIYVHTDHIIQFLDIQEEDLQPQSEE